MIKANAIKILLKEAKNMGVIRDIVDKVDQSEEEKKKLGETLDLL